MTSIEPLSSTGLAGAPSNSSAASAGASALNTNFDNFLQLLTAQLRNQDPLDPTEFVGQLTQFSQLEQQVSQGEKLDDLIAAETAGVLAARSALVGRTAAAEVDTVMLSGGAASFNYSVDSAASDVEVRIYDGSDRLVAAFAHEGGAGLGQVEWDGRNAEGALVADGAYRVEVVSASGADVRQVGSALMIGQIAEYILDGAGGNFVFANGAVVDPASVRSIGI